MLGNQQHQAPAAAGCREAAAHLVRADPVGCSGRALARPPASGSRRPAGSLASSQRGANVQPPGRCPGRAAPPGSPAAARRAARARSPSSRSNTACGAGEHRRASDPPRRARPAYMTPIRSHIWATTARSWETNSRPIALLAPKPIEEAQDPGLHDHVEGRGRLVGQQQGRPRRERHGDHDALAHAAAELVRIGRRALRASRMPTRLHHLDRARPGRAAAEPVVRADHLGDGLADAQDGIQRRHRILEDHRDARAAQRLLCRSSRSRSETPSSVIRPVVTAPRRQQPEDRARQVRLLPEPLSPTRPNASPGAMVKDTPRTTGRLPPRNATADPPPSAGPIGHRDPATIGERRRRRG